MPKIEILDVTSDDSKWHIIYEETADDGAVKKVKLVAPLDMMEWRAAEYNLNPNNIDQLIDIILCEQYIPQSHFESDKGLFKVGDIAEARAEYLRLIAEIKWHYRLTTRRKDSPVSYIRNRAIHNPSAIALKGANVMLQRHVQGAEKLPEHTLMVVSNLIKGFQNQVEAMQQQEKVKE